MKPTIGRIVHYRVSKSEVRAAMIVKLYSAGQYVQLQVFLDGINDNFSDERPGFDGTPMFSHDEQRNGLAWRTSVMQGDDIGQWNWPRIEQEDAGESSDN